MESETDRLHDKLRRYRFLHRMIDDDAMRTALAEEIAELERQLGQLGSPLPDC